MEIRLATQADVTKLAAPLSKLGAATFSEAFGHLYSAEDLAYFLNDSHSVESYEKALRDPEQPIWIAKDKGEPIAYIKLCPNGLPCDPPIPGAIEISKLYALQSYRGKGVGTQLMEAAFSYARDHGYTDMVLSVYAENYAGHRFYARHGFEKIGDYKFPVGQQLDREWIMHKRL